MSKQTAIEWLIEELGEYFPHEIGGIHLMVDRAKQMEKEQIVDAYIEGDRTAIKPEGEYKSLVIKDAEQYYQETFKQ